MGVRARRYAAQEEFQERRRVFRLVSGSCAHYRSLCTGRIPGLRAIRRQLDHRRKIDDRGRLGEVCGRPKAVLVGVHRAAPLNICELSKSCISLICRRPRSPRSPAVQQDSTSSVNGLPIDDLHISTCLSSSCGHCGSPVPSSSVRSLNMSPTHSSALEQPAH